MSEVRILFLGTPEFARYQLEHLLKDEHYKIVGVVTQPDRPAGRKMKLKPSAVKELALANNLPVITPEKIKDPEVLDIIKSWKAEAAVVVAYGQILPQEFLDIYPKKVVNLHASLLPRWRGAAPIQRAIMEGDKTTGVCLQVMVHKLDAGDVIGERKVEVTDDMDALDLHDNLMRKGADLLHVEFMDYLRGNLAPVPQDEARVTYAPKIQKSESLIEWSKSNEEIFNKIRGMKMGPGTYTLVGGKKLKIHRVEKQSGEGEPGTLIEVSGDFVTISCGKDALRIFDVQPESKSKMTIKDYLKGYTVQVGDRWGIL